MAGCAQECRGRCLLSLGGRSPLAGKVVVPGKSCRSLEGSSYCSRAEGHHDGGCGQAEAGEPALVPEAGAEAICGGKARHGQEGQAGDGDLSPWCFQRGNAA